MKGNCSHEFLIVQPGEKETFAAIYLDEKFETTTVILANDDDSFYWQGFENWNEVNEFIEELKKIATEAFGKEKAP